MFRLRALVAGLTVLMTTAVVAAGGVRQDLTQADANRMVEKLTAIASRGAYPLPDATPALRTQITEREVNAYLRFVAPPTLPTGLRDPAITIAGEDRVHGRAFVDLDAVRNSKPRGWLDPLAWVSGIVPVTVKGVLRSGGGQGTFTLEQATLAGVSVPATVVQELVTYFTKTPETPEGVDLAKPFALPANIDKVETRVGQATIVQ
jgi:hypothetical protein